MNTIIWSALIIPNIAYLIIIHFVSLNVQYNVVPKSIEYTILGLVIVVFYLSRLLFKRAKELSDLKQQRIFLIASWALSDFLGVIGILYYIAIGNKEFATTLILLSVLRLVMLFPKGFSKTLK